jgi:hypothetical protein
VARESQAVHHTFWERRAYQTPIERTFRGLGALMVPLWINTHKDLHHFVEPPKKPSREAMLITLAHIEDWTASRQQGSPDTIARVADMYEGLVNTGAQDDKRTNEAVSDHLRRQLEFINEGYYYL